MTNSNFKTIKNEIINVFNTNVKGVVIPDMSSLHDGAEGDWLTDRMGLKVNGNNEPDYKGFEMKKISEKITFGDWSADYYLWQDSKNNFTRDSFLESFGTSKKAGRYSWSGETFPSKFGVFTSSGQILTIDKKKKDIVIIYDFSKDKRKAKNPMILQNLNNGKIVLARWKYNSLKNKFENKFNQYGFFICLKTNNVYSDIKFGPSLDFVFFLKNVKNGKIILDSGMYFDINKSNSRPYSNWRADKSFWLKYCK
jgi:hypothetical protein